MFQLQEARTNADDNDVYVVSEAQTLRPVRLADQTLRLSDELYDRREQSYLAGVCAAAVDRLPAEVLLTDGATSSRERLTPRVRRSAVQHWRRSRTTAAFG